MTELHTLTFILKMCGIMMMEGTIQPSEAFECKQAEKFMVEYHFNGEYNKYKDYMVYELQRDFSTK
jgi:hypothetical protein|tara:strand:- start:323 stop:520 length:198 start_codon:yes stop_codon:yes gene_type:complete